MRMKISSVKRRSFCHGFKMLIIMAQLRVAGLHWNVWSRHTSDRNTVFCYKCPVKRLPCSEFSSDGVSWMKSFVLWLQFNSSMFLMVQLTITSIGLDNGLGPNKRQAIILTSNDWIHWRLYAALCGVCVCVVVVVVVVGIIAVLWNKLKRHIFDEYVAPMGVIKTRMIYNISFCIGFP